MRKSQKQKPPKRIVSKAEYASVNASRLRDSILSTAAIVTGLICSSMAALAAIVLLLSSQPPEIFQGFLFCTVIGYMFLKVGLVTKRKVERQNVEIAPLTRANIADLQAIESLVRASGMPMQSQGTLLRAANEKHDEQE